MSNSKHKQVHSLRLEIATALKKDAGRKSLKLNACALKQKVLFPDVSVVISSSQLDAASRQWLSRSNNQRTVKRDGFALIPLATDAHRFCQVGVEGKLLKTTTLSSGEKNYHIKGIRRVILDSVATRETEEGGGYHSVVIPFPKDKRPHPRAILPKMANIKEALTKLLKVSKRMDKKTGLVLRQSLSDPDKFCNLITQHLTMTYEEQLPLLSMPLPKRLARILSLVGREIEMLKFSSTVEKETEERISNSERVNFIKENINLLRSELEDLGEEVDPASKETEKLTEDINRVKMPAHVRAVAHKELEKLELAPYGSTDYMISHQYLTWIKDLHWVADQADFLPSFQRAKRVLNRHHAGLEAVKTRILEHLAVITHTHNIGGQILLFVGAPGVGKTSLAKSIAAALERKFAQISLGGMREEMEVRGLRRTYTGAMPGKIIQAITQAGSASAVILLDEIDKVGNKDNHNHSDVQSALLEVLDYQHNNTYRDHYIDIPFDLSSVMFIATANDVSSIPAPLLNRLDVVEIPSYSNAEKITIAQRHLLPRIKKNLRIGKDCLNFSAAALELIIQDYTQEAGVRELHRNLEKIARKTILSHVAKDKEIAAEINAQAIKTYLGNPCYQSEPNPSSLPAGMSIALAYTCNGGEIMHVETSMMLANNSEHSEQSIILTGQLGQVMRESALTAQSYLFAHHQEVGVDVACLRNAKLHVHLPDAATPKDGPSAGLAIYLALVSQVLNIPICAGIAITGEITLRGHVLAVGGIREKVLAACRYHKHTIVMPSANINDLLDVPKEVLRNLNFYFVKDMQEALACVQLKANATLAPQRNLTHRKITSLAQNVLR
ncbi:MAG: endopeptidase La [Pseudomonadota bacterium]|nr:endopeptidase La [Pseudomonadota bacterium]